MWFRWCHEGGILVIESVQLVPSLCAIENTERRWPPASHRESSHQILIMLEYWSRTSSLQNCEKTDTFFKPPNLWYFVMAAWSDWYRYCNSSGHFNCFWPRGLWDLCSRTRDWTWASGSGSTESQPLNHQGTPDTVIQKLKMYPFPPVGKELIITYGKQKSCIFFIIHLSVVRINF